MLAQLQDPLYELALTIAIVATYFVARAARRDPGVFPRFAASLRLALRGQRGAAQLTQQSVSSTITIVTAAFAVAAIGYAVFALASTAICSQNITNISSGEDLRFTQSGAYSANGNVTAAAMVDADGTNNYIKSDPHDPISGFTTFYSFTATQTNGDWSYVINCPGTHPSWTLQRINGYASTKTGLTLTGPGGTVTAK